MRHSPFFTPIAFPILLPVRGVLGATFGDRATPIAVRGWMASSTTKAGGLLTRFIFGGSRAGSARW